MSKIKGFNIVCAKDSKAADIYFYDVIGWDGNTANEVVRRLAALDVDVMNVRINSPGGLVFEGFAIYNALIAHKATIKVFIDGLAASIASIIAMAGDEITMAENAMMMVHQPSVIVGGTSKKLRQQADVLDQLEENIVNIYVDRTGMKKDDVVAMIADGKETWMNAKDAVEKKFATATGAKLKMAACGTFDLKPLNFASVPADRTFEAFSSPEEEPASPAFDPLNLRKKRLALVDIV
jgi:ATP-dependent Clp protease protease subunit